MKGIYIDPRVLEVRVSHRMLHNRGSHLFLLFNIYYLLSHSKYHMHIPHRNNRKNDKEELELSKYYLTNGWTIYGPFNFVPRSLAGFPE